MPVILEKDVDRCGRVVLHFCVRQGHNQLSDLFTTESNFYFLHCRLAYP